MIKAVRNPVVCCRVAEKLGMASSPEPQLLMLLQMLQQKAFHILGPEDFDPKYFIDLPLVADISDAVTAFRNLENTNSSFKNYLKQHFGEPGSDLVEYLPSDFEAEPLGFLPEVKNPKVRKWALEVHSLWKVLSRKPSDSVYQRPDQHTLLPLPSNVVIPGSRFREVYYWDSYWIIRGLLASKMHETAMCVVNNLVSFADKYGFVLNGARSYYTNRSQPPLLSAMLRAIYERVGDMGVLEKALPVLIKEYEFWNSGDHKVIIGDANGMKHVLNRYNARWDMPRPECAIFDIETASGLSEKEKRLLYYEIATVCESGWDFSSRWMGDGKNLKTLKASSIVPVDLNVFLLQMELNISFFAKELAETSVKETFDQAATARKIAINSILWNSSMCQWLDYWLPPVNSESDNQQLEDVYIWDENNQNKGVFASNFFPLWVDVFHLDPCLVESVIHRFVNSGLLEPSGIATSLSNTGQQWDFPNGWAPIQHIIIEGIAKETSGQGTHLAEDIARRWLKTNYEIFQKTGHMHEKYDVQGTAKVGSGGEYSPQTGFGWTNGVALALLEQFGWPLNLAIDCS